MKWSRDIRLAVTWIFLSGYSRQWACALLIAQ